MPVVDEYSLSVGSDDVTVDVEKNGDRIVQTPTVTAFVNSAAFDVIDAKLVKSWHTEAGRLELTGVWDENFVPSSGDSVEVEVNGVPFFTGDAKSVNVTEQEEIEIVALDLTKKLLNRKVTEAFTSAAVITIVRALVDYIDEDVKINATDEEFIVGTISYTDVPITKVLNEVTKRTNTVWYVDRTNTLNVTKPQVRIWKLDGDFVGETPGVNADEMPYQKVVVTGQSPASEFGQEAAHLFTIDNPTATAGNGEPVYNYTSNQIRTEGEAKAVAQAIYDKFRRQAATGTLNVIGQGEQFLPYDVMRTPDGDSFSIKKMTHDINSDDGYVTEIEAGGLWL